MTWRILAAGGSNSIYLVNSDHLFPGTPEVEWRRTKPVKWRPQSWERAKDPGVAEAVERARQDLQRSLERSLDTTCTSLGLDPFTTWRWPHNDEIDRERYRLGLEWRAEQAMAMQVIDPKDFNRVTTVPF